MKLKLKSILVLAVVSLSIAANAQLGSPSTPVYSGTRDAFAAITNNTTCTMTNVADVSNQGTVCIAFTGELSGAGTTANTVNVQQSADRSNWANLMSFSVTPAGTTPVTVVTNLTGIGAPYIRINTIANANANTGYITNYTVKVTGKR